MLNCMGVGGSSYTLESLLGFAAAVSSKMTVVLKGKTKYLKVVTDAQK